MLMALRLEEIKFEARPVYDALLPRLRFGPPPLARAYSLDHLTSPKKHVGTKTLKCTFQIFRFSPIFEHKTVCKCIKGGLGADI
jgi:hypothetical protein